MNDGGAAVDDRRPALLEILGEARELGFLGPGPVDAHVDHAAAFAAGLRAPGRALDLGAGGGVPGLALAQLYWPTCCWVLVDAGAKRCAFLERAVEALGLTERVTTVCGRAEEIGRRPELRATFDLVTARGFAPPGVTAECGAPFLVPGGCLVVSEPPGGAPDRWNDAGLAELGLARAADWPAVAGAAVAAFVATGPCDARYPRRVGIPAKRPLF